MREVCPYCHERVAQQMFLMHTVSCAEAPLIPGPEWPESDSSILDVTVTGDTTQKKEEDTDGTT